MASLALHSFDHSRQQGLGRFYDVRGMAIEALTHFHRASETAGGFQQIVRRDGLAPIVRSSPRRAEK